MKKIIVVFALLSTQTVMAWDYARTNSAPMASYYMNQRSQPMMNRSPSSNRPSWHDAAAHENRVFTRRLQECRQRGWSC